ncbi:MAG: ACT domain-containing protein [Candidatus Marinimicrobia bacterium]|nr:ACT domain-containing protein [Candidatus Neomarinimicrobiota bacterium]
MVESVVRRVVTLSDGSGEDLSTALRPTPPEQKDAGGDRLIIAVFGVNQPGIMAGVSQILSRHRCNILDISQKLMQEFFTMILVVDLTGADTTFEQLQQEFDKLGNSLGIKIYAQHEDVFRAVNRL